MVLLSALLLEEGLTTSYERPCPRHRTLPLFTHLPMKMEQTECFETSAYKIQTPGNYPEENIQHSFHLFVTDLRSMIVCLELFSLWSFSIVLRNVAGTDRVPETF
jgi:hypothetical protein